MKEIPTNTPNWGKFVIQQIAEINTTIADYKLSQQSLLDERKTLRSVVAQLKQERDVFEEALATTQIANRKLEKATKTFIVEGRKLLLRTIARLDEDDFDSADEHFNQLRRMFAEMQSSLSE